MNEILYLLVLDIDFHTLLNENKTKAKFIVNCKYKNVFVQ